MRKVLCTAKCTERNNSCKACCQKELKLKERENANNSLFWWNKNCFGSEQRGLESCRVVGNKNKSNEMICDEISVRMLEGAF